jgi:hypothetical protein
MRRVLCSQDADLSVLAIPAKDFREQANSGTSASLSVTLVLLCYRKDAHFATRSGDASGAVRCGRGERGAPAQWDVP